MRLLRRSRQLRVAVPVNLLRLRNLSGHARVWSHVLRELDDLVTLVPADPKPARRVDLWLGDGHAGALGAAEPVVVQLHEASWHDPDTVAETGPVFLERITAATALGVASATAIVTCSEHSRRQILSEYTLAEDRVVSVLHGVDSDVFTPAVAGRGRARVATALGADRPYVLFVASLFPRKNLPVVRDAVTALAHDGLPHALALVVQPAGDRKDSTDLLAAATAELPGAPGRVARLDAPDDASLAELMADCAVFCLPSRSEGFGLTVLEAMACGAPVVTSDRGALPEVVADAGLTVAPTAADVTAALGEVVRNDSLARSLGIRARERAVTLSWRRTALGWRDVLQRAVEMGR